jgi:hypothetical protein
MAPSLDCEVLKSEWDIFDPANGQVAKRTDIVATQVQLGEPLSSLFDVPDWPERSPIQSEEDYFRKYKNGVIDPKLYSAFERREQIYNSRRK